MFLRDVGDGRVVDVSILDLRQCSVVQRRESFGVDSVGIHTAFQEVLDALHVWFKCSNVKHRVPLLVFIVKFCS